MFVKKGAEISFVEFISRALLPTPSYMSAFGFLAGFEVFHLWTAVA